VERWFVRFPTPVFRFRLAGSLGSERLLTAADWHGSIYIVALPRSAASAESSSVGIDAAETSSSEEESNLSEGSTERSQKRSGTKPMLRLNVRVPLTMFAAGENEQRLVLLTASGKSLTGFVLAKKTLEEYMHV